MTISQFDVFPNPLRSSRDGKPFLVCIQHPYLDHLRTRLVAPLLVEITGTLTRLNPTFVVNGQRVMLDPTDLQGIRVEQLRKPITNLEHERYRIVSALDLVFTGI